MEKNTAHQGANGMRENVRSYRAGSKLAPGAS